MPKGDRISRKTATSLNLATIAAIDKYFAQTTSLSLAGTTLTPDDIKAVFQAELDARKKVDATRAILSKQVLDAQNAGKKRAELRRLLKAYLLATFGAQAVTMLLDFRFSVPKRMGPKKIAAKARGVEAAMATRAARHTMGKQQKKAIKGTPTAETKKA